MVVERTERESAILAKLADDGRLSVSGLASDFGVSIGRTADAALGYFINPLVTVALAS